MQKFLLVIAVVFAFVAQPVMANEIGRVKNVTAGGVEVVRGDTTYTATAGFRLHEGDRISTRRGQTVGITFIDNTRISVAPRTRMIVSRYLFDRADGSGESVMEVQRGAIGVDTGRLSATGNMRFKTPSSTLGVRGTTFVIEVG